MTLSRWSGLCAGFLRPLEERRVKSMVLVMGFSRRVVPIRARSMVSGPGEGKEDVSSLRFHTYMTRLVSNEHTPNKVCAILERKQSRWQLSGADHRRKDDLAPVIDAILRDWDARRRRCHDACKCSKHPITDKLLSTACGDSGGCESIIEKLRVYLARDGQQDTTGSSAGVKSKGLCRSLCFK